LNGNGYECASHIQNLLATQPKYLHIDNDEANRRFLNNGSLQTAEMPGSKWITPKAQRNSVWNPT